MPSCLLTVRNGHDPPGHPWKPRVEGGLAFDILDKLGEGSRLG